MAFNFKIVPLSITFPKFCKSGLPPLFDNASEATSCALFLVTISAAKA